MRLLYIMFFLVTVGLSYKVFAESEINKNELLVKLKKEVVNFRNHIKGLEGKEFELYISRYLQNVLKQLRYSKSEKELLEKRIPLLAEFEMKDLYLKHCNRVIQANSTNLLIPLGPLLGWAFDDGDITAGFFLFGGYWQIRGGYTIRKTVQIFNSVRIS